MAEFFSVPVGDSKETKTSSFPLTSVPSLDIKTLGGSSPILAKDKNQSQRGKSLIKLKTVFPARNVKKCSM